MFLMYDDCELHISVDDETMLKVIYKHMLNLMKYELCSIFIAEENGIDLTSLEETE